MRNIDEICLAAHVSGEQISVQAYAQSRSGCDSALAEANTELDLESQTRKKRKKKHHNKNSEAIDSQGKVSLTKSSSAESADLPNELEAVNDAKEDQNSCVLALMETNTELDLECPPKCSKRKKKCHNKNLVAISESQRKESLTNSSSAISADLYNELKAVRDGKEDQNSCDLAQQDAQDRLNLGCCREKKKRKKEKHKWTQESPQDAHCTTSPVEDRSVEESLDLVVDGSTTLDQYHPKHKSGVSASGEEKFSMELLNCSTERKRKRKRKRLKRTQDHHDDFQGDASSIRTGYAQGAGDKLEAVSDMRTVQHHLELIHDCDSTNIKTQANVVIESFEEKKKRKKEMCQTTKDATVAFLGDASTTEASYVERGSANELQVDRSKTANQHAFQLDSNKMDHDRTVLENKTSSLGDTSLIKQHACDAISGLVWGDNKCRIKYKRRERVRLPCRKSPEHVETIVEPSPSMTRKPGLDHSSAVRPSLILESKLEDSKVMKCASTVDAEGVSAEKIASDCSNDELLPSKNNKVEEIRKDVDVMLNEETATQVSFKAPEVSCDKFQLGNILGVGRKTMTDHHLPELGSTENWSRTVVSKTKNPPGNTCLTNDHNCDGNAGLVTVQRSIETYKRKKLRSECSNSRVVTAKALLSPSLEVKSCELSESKPQSLQAGNDVTGLEVQESVLAEKIISDCSKSDLATKESKKVVEMINVVGRNVREEIPAAFRPNKKLLVLDINGLLADIVPGFPKGYRCDLTVSNKSVFRRPYCSDFLYFCFEKFNVGVWSSRTKKNMDKIIPFIFRSYRPKLIFCWNASRCTQTGFSTIGSKSKPLVLKELRKLWENQYSDLPWHKGVFNETNTLLLDDSPYKALRNPVHTAVFPFPYDFRNDDDFSLGPGGDLREYLEGLANAGNVQEFVSKHPFGQKAITESNASWGFYCKIIGHDSSQQEEGASSSRLLTCTKSGE